MLVSHGCVIAVNLQHFAQIHWDLSPQGIHKALICASIVVQPQIKSGLNYTAAVLTLEMQWIKQYLGNVCENVNSEKFMKMAFIMLQSGFQCRCLVSWGVRKSKGTFMNYVITHWKIFNLRRYILDIIQIMVGAEQATSHYLGQEWPISMSPWGITRPQWVDKCKTIIPATHDLIYSYIKYGKINVSTHNTLRLQQDNSCFAHDISKSIFLK